MKPEKCLEQLTARAEGIALLAASAVAAGEDWAAFVGPRDVRDPGLGGPDSAGAARFVAFERSLARLEAAWGLWQWNRYYERRTRSYDRAMNHRPDAWPLRLREASMEFTLAKLHHLPMDVIRIFDYQLSSEYHGQSADGYSPDDARRLLSYVVESLRSGLVAPYGFMYPADDPDSHQAQVEAHQYQARKLQHTGAYVPRVDDCLTSHLLAWFRGATQMPADLVLPC